MSHFSVLVIGENIEEQLQPFHEFECTGVNDEYVIDVDKTQEVLDRVEGKGDYQNGEKEDLIEALSYYGLEERIVESEEEVDRDGDHRYGFAIVQDGKLIKAVDRTNPRRQWDWWIVGGRWTGYFKLKPGSEGEVGRPGLMTPAAEAGWVDSALKRDIDFDGMRDFEEAEARFRHQTVVKWLGHIPNLTPWSEFRKQIEAQTLTPDEARAAYHAQPDQVRMKEIHPAKDALTEKEYNLLSWLELEPYGCSEDQFAARARDRAISTFALVHNSQWFEKGSMGWWGMVSDEKDENEWVTEFTKLVDSLPEDTRLTVVDCHI